jgi:pilus assembly protein CpaB
MGRLRGLVWLTAGIVVAMLAGIVGFMTLSRAAAQTGTQETSTVPTVPVVVAARAVAVRAGLTAQDLAVRQMPADAVPEGALRDTADAQGKLTLVELTPGEVVLGRRLLDPNIIPPDGRTAVFMADEEVLMAFPAGDLLTRMNMIKAGDRVDVYFSLNFPTDREMQSSDTTTTGGGGSTGDEQHTFVALQNVAVAQVIVGTGDNPAPQAVLFTLTPQDALVLKYLKDAGGVQDLVLRAPDVDRLFETDPVDVDYMINRYGLPIEVGR